MSRLATLSIRLPLRIQSLVSLTSLLVRIQPISSLHSPTTRPPLSIPTHSHQSPSQGGGTKGVQSARGPIGSGENLNCPIRGGQYMCGNSLSSMASSNAAVIQPKGTHTATFIFLHGLGDQGYGWCENFEMIKQANIKYIFPHAGMMPVTLNMGMTMPSWFDIISLGVGGREDDEGIKKASENLLKLVAEEEKAGIPSNRIVLGGFSQGGAVSLYTAVTNDKQFAGLVGLSTWMPLYKSFSTEGVNKKALPVLQCHGTADPLLPFQLGQLTHEFIKTQINDPEFKAYPGLAHSSSLEEMEAVKQFLQKVVP